jgi:hypothetical protein
MAKKKINPGEEQHFQECNACGELYDMRDIGDVAFHGFDQCLEGGEPKDIPYSSSKKVGESVEYTKDKQAVHLN